MRRRKPAVRMGLEHFDLEAAKEQKSTADRPAHTYSGILTGFNEPLRSHFGMDRPTTTDGIQRNYGFWERGPT